MSSGECGVSAGAVAGSGALRGFLKLVDHLGEGSGRAGPPGHKNRGEEEVGGRDHPQNIPVRLAVHVISPVHITAHHRRQGGGEGWFGMP